MAAMSAEERRKHKQQQRKEAVKAKKREDEARAKEAAAAEASAKEKAAAKKPTTAKRCVSGQAGCRTLIKHTPWRNAECCSTSAGEKLNDCCCLHPAAVKARRKTLARSNH